MVEDDILRSIVVSLQSDFELGLVEIVNLHLPII